MRVLEQCISSATPDIKVQINALREAFSIGTSQPFELKPTLGLQSPTLEHQPTPAGFSRHSPASATAQHSANWMSTPDPLSSKTMSPSSEYAPPYNRIPDGTMPVTVSVAYNPTIYPTPSGYTSHPTSMHQAQPAQQFGYSGPPILNTDEQTTPVWDPSGIFQQWNSAFGGQPQPSPPQGQQVDARVTPVTAPIQPQHHSPTSHPSVYGARPPMSNPSALVPDSTLPTIPTVTPMMWQDAFTTAYVSGQGNKRYRPEEQAWYDQNAKRRG